MEMRYACQMKKIHHLLKVCFLLTFTLSAIALSIALGQSGTTYEVQSGDTLNGIARANGLTLGQIVALNNITNPNAIYVGQVLNISMEGITLQEDALINPLDDETMEITSIEDEVSAIVAETTSATSPVAEEQAAPEELAYFTDAVWPETYPAPISNMTFQPPEAWQGRSFGLNIELSDAAFLNAMFLGQEYSFLPNPEDITKQAAILAVPVLQEPGVYPLNIEMRSMSGDVSNLTLPMPVGAVDYSKENINLPPSSTEGLGPDTSRLESERVTSICGKFDPIQRWESAFRYPTDTPVFTSAFGINRAYNGGPYNSFHRGLDLRAREGTPVYASENGVVRLAEELAIRGNAVLLDHGLGMCTAYSHMSELAVTEGEEVTKGQLIGYAGATGLVTAAHVHWELRVMGIPVNPSQWAEALPTTE